MTAILIGTSGGVFRVNGGAAVREDGPPDGAYLAIAGDEAYALTHGGVLWRRDGGGGWQQAAEQPVPDEPWALSADPRLPQRLYLGVSPALLYRSDDGGATWQACDSVKQIPGYETWTFPPPPHIPHVRSIAPDPAQAGAVYIGVEEGGVFRSPDGGDTWESLNDGLYWDVHTVTPARGGPLYSTTGNGFYRSDDGGAHWTRRMDGVRRSYTVPFAVAPSDPQRLFMAVAAGPPPTWSRGADAALYRSDDAGERWTQLSEGLPERFDRMVSALVLDGETAYAASGGSVYEGQDGGERWRTLAEGLPGVRALGVLAG